MPFKDAQFERVYVLRQGYLKANKPRSEVWNLDWEWGKATGLSPDANGNATVTHRMSTAPEAVVVNLFGDVGNVFVDIQDHGFSDFTLRFKDGSGNDVTSGTYTVMWLAKSDFQGNF